MEHFPLLSKKPSPTSLHLNTVTVPIITNQSPKKLRSTARTTTLTLSSIAGIAIIAATVSLVLVATIAPSSPKVQQSRTLRAASEGSVDLTIPQGDLRGYVRTSRGGRAFTAFYKVPFAAPPIGELRFKDPEPAQAWEGVRDVKEVAPQCIQKSKYSSIEEAVGEEDCLYANVYFPGDVPPNNYPTMVYIHGGGLTDGNGSRYGAEYFMDTDVVLVTFQYRLGALGFLNTGDDEIRGNMGFKDQVMALRWVSENIQHFGGDSSRVTIFGNSAGAISVSFQMVSPMSKGLFHRAITQSGSSVCPGLGMIDFDAQATVKQVSRLLNCSLDNGTAQFATCLRSLPASDVALARANTTYTLTLEANNSNPFMPVTPYQALTSTPSNANPVPYIIGINNAEWLGMALRTLLDTDLIQSLNQNFAERGRELLPDLKFTDEQIESVKQFYFGDQEITNSSLYNMTNLVSDRAFTHCGIVSARLHSKYAPAYNYYLSKPPAKSYADKAVPGFPARELGLVSHADELQFIFPYYGYPEIPNDDPDYFAFSSYMIRVWANFAATGDPSHDGHQWSSVSSSAPFWFELNDTPGETQVLAERIRFWDQFTDQELGYDV